MLIDRLMRWFSASQIFILCQARRHCKALVFNDPNVFFFFFFFTDLDTFCLHFPSVSVDRIFMAYWNVCYLLLLFALRWGSIGPEAYIYHFSAYNELLLVSCKVDWPLLFVVDFPCENDYPVYVPMYTSSCQLALNSPVWVLSLYCKSGCTVCW